MSRTIARRKPDQTAAPYRMAAPTIDHYPGLHAAKELEPLEWPHRYEVWVLTHP